MCKTTNEEARSSQLNYRMRCNRCNQERDTTARCDHCGCPEYTLIAMPEPAYQRDGITIYHGDCLEILPVLELGCADAVITDPVWPNALSILAGSKDPYGLMEKAAAHFPKLVRRVVIHIGMDSDPRFLTAIPKELPFLRVCWLRYARPSYKGRLLVNAETAYVYGEHAPTSDYCVAPGEMVHTRTDRKTMRHTADGDKTIDYEDRHPCPRQSDMVHWLVRWFGGQTTLDPFMGSGTTLVACIRAGRGGIGIELERKYVDMAIDRCEKEFSRFALLDTIPKEKGDTQTEWHE